MAFMKRDVNIGLLILIIASIILFSAFSVYYQTTFRAVSLEYKEKLDQLGSVTKELATQKQALNETYSLRVKAEQDKDILDVRYRDVTDENVRLESDKSSLQTEVISVKSNLAGKTAELDATKNLLSQTQSSLSAARSEVTSLKSRNSKLGDRLDSVCDAYTPLNGGVEHSDC